MDEKRRAPRLKEESEITINVISRGENHRKEKILYNHSKNVSVSGAGIQAHIFLPVNTLLMIEMTLKTLRQMITVIGKVKWNKVVFENESYEAGVEFFNTPNDAIKTLSEYVSCKQKFKNLNTRNKCI